MKIFHRRDRKERRGNLKYFFGSVSLRALRLCGKIFIKSSFSHPALLLILATIFCFFAPIPVLAQSVDSNIQEGITDYRQQNFEQAEINFRKAQKEQPDNPRLNYNLANSHYKNGKYPEALKSYTHTTGNDTPPDLKKNSLYNSGNTLYRMGKLEESISAYKKALEITPGDMDAKFNLEFVREKLKEKNQQDQKQNQSQNGDSGNSKNPQQTPSPNNDSDKNDDRQNSAQKDNQETSEEPKQETDPSTSEQKESNPSELAENQGNSISKNQAEQWLSGLDEDLKKFSQKQARQEKGNASVSSRDW
jgi:Ca-activated chloride channel family protein